MVPFVLPLFERIILKTRIALILALALSLVAAPFTAYADETAGSLSGTVHGASGAPLAQAQVVIDGPQHRLTQSDAQGNFAFSDLRPGIYRLDVNKGGYLPATLDSITIIAGSNQPVAVSLEQADLSSLKTIARIVSSSHSSINTGASQSTFVAREQFTQLANPQINDVVARIPGAGIERGSTSPNTSISLGGAQPYETQVLLDGHPLSAGRYGVWFSQFFSSYMLQGIEAESGPGNTTPFAATAVGGTANLLTPGFTTKPTYEFVTGMDNFASTYSNLLATGKLGRLSYVIDAGYQGSNGRYTPSYGCIVKPSDYSKLNTPNATGIIQTCLDMSGPLATKGEIFKLKYDFSPVTSFEAGFVGSQSGYNPQGAAYAQYGGMVNIVPCFNGSQCTNPNYSNLVGTKVPAYIFYPGSQVTNNQPIFSGQLRTAVGDNTLLVRPYAGNITRSIDGSGEALYPDHYTAAGTPVMQSAFSLLESDKLRGTTVSFIHPFGENSVTATYDYHSDDTFAYYGDPSSVNTPDTISKFGTFALTGDLAVARNLRLKAGAYATSWDLKGSKAGPIVSNKPTLVPFTRNSTRFDPHVAFVFQPASSISYRFAAGTSASYPYASQVSGVPFITKPSATAPYGQLTQKNPGLDPESAFSVDLGMDKRFGNGSVLSFDFLDTRVKNVFETIITPQNGPIDPVSGNPQYSAIVQPVNLANLNSQMFTLSYAHEPTLGLGYSVTGTLSRSIVNGVPASFYTSPTAYVQPANGQQQCSNGGSELCLPYLKAFGQLQYALVNGTTFGVNANFEGKNNTYNQPPFFIFNGFVRRPVTSFLDLQASVQNLFNTNTFSGLPEFNLGVPQIGQSSTGLGSIIVPRIPAPTRTLRVQLRWHVNR